MKHVNVIMTSEDIATRAYYYWLNGHDDAFLNWILAEEVESVRHTTNANYTGIYEEDKALIQQGSMVVMCPGSPINRVVDIEPAAQEQQGEQQEKQREVQHEEQEKKPKKPFWRKSIRKGIVNKFGRKKRLAAKSNT